MWWEKLKNMKSIEEYEESKELELNEAQLKSAKKVYKAMRDAHKLGVQFWDNYGTLACYNSKKIARFHMQERPNSISNQNYQVYHEEMLNNFQCGNSDDELFFEIK